MRLHFKTAPSAGLAVACTLALALTGCGDRQVRAGSNQIKTERVHLVWKGGANPWKVKLNGGGEMDPGAAKTVIAKGDAPTMFLVDIQGSTPATFKNPGGLSVWSGPKLPTQQGINSDQIVGPVITNNGKLIFFDLNQGPPVALNYALHFNNGVPSVDPIIDNGGGHDFQ